MSWDDWNFGAEEDPDYRRRALENKLLKPLGISLTSNAIIGGRPENPAETERKAREAADRLARHDKLFGVERGCTMPGYKVEPPTFTAGDPDSDGVDDRDLASMDEARR